MFAEMTSNKWVWLHCWLIVWMSSKVVTLTGELICLTYIVMYVYIINCCIKELTVCESYVGVTVSSVAQHVNHSEWYHSWSHDSTCECQWCVWQQTSLCQCSSSHSSDCSTHSIADTCVILTCQMAVGTAMILMLSCMHIMCWQLWYFLCSIFWMPNSRCWHHGTRW